MIEDLEKLGLTKNEATVYYSLLKLGRTTAGKIIKDTNLHRNIVYFNLDKLIEKSLIGYITISNIKHFETSKPYELKDYILKKKEKILNQEKLVEKIIPEIEKQRKILPQAQDAIIYKGIKSIKLIFDEMLKTKDEILLFATGWGGKQRLGKYFDLWNKKIKLQKVKVRAVVNEAIKLNAKEYPYNMRYLKGDFIQPTTIMVFDKKVLNIIWEEQPIAIMIKSPMAYGTYKNYFEQLWKQSKAKPSY